MSKSTVAHRGCGLESVAASPADRKGLSQDALCEKIGVPQSTWVYWERRGKFIGREIILKTATALGVSVEELLRLDR